MGYVIEQGKGENCNIASRSRVSNTPLLLYNLKEVKVCSRIMGGEFNGWRRSKSRMTQSGKLVTLDGG